MNKMKSHKISQNVQKLVLLVVAMVACEVASAATAPTNLNSLGGQAYDLFFNQMYDSGIAFIISGALGLFGFMQIKENWKQALGYGAGAGGVAGLPTMLTALGASI